MGLLPTGTRNSLQETAFPKCWVSTAAVNESRTGTPAAERMLGPFGALFSLFPLVLPQSCCEGTLPSHGSFPELLPVLITMGFSGTGGKQRATSHGRTLSCPVCCKRKCGI